MVLIYAATADLTTWTEAAAPANATQLLRSASLLVREHTLTAYYDVDPATNLPSDPDIKQAFSDATCAQVAMWVAAGIDPTTTGIPQAGVLRGKRIGTAALDYDTAAVSSVTGMQARRAAATTLCQEAVLILQQARLNDHGPWTVG
jgi:hypothetical protein